jgi:hypothetical protein
MRSLRRITGPLLFAVGVAVMAASAAAPASYGEAEASRFATSGLGGAAALATTLAAGTHADQAVLRDTELRGRSDIGGIPLAALFGALTLIVIAVARRAPALRVASSPGARTWFSPARLRAPPQFG